MEIRVEPFGLRFGDGNIIEALNSGNWGHLVTLSDEKNVMKLQVVLNLDEAKKLIVCLQKSIICTQEFPRTEM